MDFLHNHHRAFSRSPLDSLLPHHRFPHDWDFYDFDRLFPPLSGQNRHYEREHRDRHRHHNHRRSRDHYRDRDGRRDRNEFPRSFMMDDISHDIEEAFENLMIGPTLDLRRIFHSFGFNDNHRIDDNHNHRHREGLEEQRFHRPRQYRCEPQEQSEDRTKSKPITCPICLEPTSTQARTLSCEHTFHRSCISKWQKINNTCPTCRAQID